jgi:hypothetical protein
MRLANLLFVSAAAAQAPLIPEGIHGMAKGPVAICGITASSVAEFRGKVEGSALKRQDVGEHFDVFASDMTEDGLVQWAFTKPGEPAYPAATCRRVYKTRDGAWRSERRMRCEAGRGSCDTLFLQFRQVDEQARQALQGRR